MYIYYLEDADMWESFSTVKYCKILAVDESLATQKAIKEKNKKRSISALNWSDLITFSRKIKKKKTNDWSCLFSSNSL